MAVPMANDPPFATLNHFAADLGIPSESDLLRIGISETRTSRLNGQHNLPEMLVLAHMRLRRHGFGKREATVDGQLELARRHRTPQIGAHAASNLAHLL